MAVTTQQLLDSVNAAINEILVAGGTIEMEINGRRVRKDLDGLRTLKKDLLSELASTGSNGPLRSYVNFGGRPS